MCDKYQNAINWPIYMFFSFKSSYVRISVIIVLLINFKIYYFCF